MQVLLRRMMRDNNATYTDLTPIEKVQPLLGCLGFLPINNGVAIHNLSVLSLQPCKGARVTAYSAPEHHSTHRRAVADHEGYGCLAFQIEGSAGISPIILKPRCIRSVPVVDVIFSEDNDNLRNALPSLARKLLKLGYLGLILDIPVGTTPKTNASQLILTRSRRRFVKNGRRTIGSDYTYSEVVYFDL
jgi:hypothetical protein